MIIKLKDGTEIVETSEKAELVKRAIEQGAIGIELGDKWFRSDWVASIMPGGTKQVREDRLLDRPDYRGQHSPAKEKLRAQLQA
jgi:hypothetical protein